MGSKTKQDPRVTKRRVTMTSVVAAGRTDDGKLITATHEAVDYVNPEFLDAYVADARTRWQSVTVSDEPDAGPGGYEGQTAVPDGIDHTEAGTVRPAEKKRG